MYVPGFLINDKDEKTVFSLFSNLKKSAGKDKTEEIDLYENDGIKKMLNWLQLLSSVNDEKNVLLFQEQFAVSSPGDIVSPKDLLDAAYDRLVHIGR